MARMPLELPYEFNHLARVTDAVRIMIMRLQR